jgi:hypothetical protein
VQVKFGKYVEKNRYSRESSLASMAKIGIHASLAHFGTFGKFGECRLDCFIHLKYVFCA